MAFKRILQVGSSMLFAALSFALVEQLCFESEIPANQNRSINATAENFPPKAEPIAPSEPHRAPASEKGEVSAASSTAAALTSSRLAQKRKSRPNARPINRRPAFEAEANAEAGVEPKTTEVDALPNSLEPAAPIAAANGPRKLIWLWLSSGAGKHTLRHSLANGTNSNFRSLQTPSLGLRAGFEVGKIGLDASYDSSPGKVSSAPNATIEGGSYHWTALRADATWRGLGDSWKLRIGAQQHTSPFLYPDNATRKIYLRRVRINFAALGLEWMPTISEHNRLEARATYLHSLNADSLDRAEISLSRKASGNISLGWVHSASEHFRLGAFVQSEFQNFGFSYRASAGATPHQGNQKLTSHSLGLRFGWEY